MRADAVLPLSLIHISMEPVTKIATENEDTIWEQIEAVEEKSDAIFQRNAALWEKLDEKMCIRDRARSRGRSPVRRAA